MFPEQIIYISTILSLYASSFYIKDILKGKVKPNRVSWFIWSFAPFIAFWIQFKNGAGISSIPVFMSGFIPLLIFLFSFKNKDSYWKLNILDYLCLVLSIIAIFIWVYLKEGVLATTFAILADLIAYIPTYVKSWKKPHTENIFPYLAGMLGMLFVLLTTKSFSFIYIGFPLYIFFGNFIEILIVLFRKKYDRS